MISLDDLEALQRVDAQNYLSHIDHLPEQLRRAWEIGQALDLPPWRGLRQVVIVGMGGSAIGADLLQAYAEPHCPAPVVVQRDYGLPSWAAGPETLVIFSSFSGNTEETLSALEPAMQRGCRGLALTTGGALAQRARQAGLPVWTFACDCQPRAAVGFSFGLLLSALVRLGLLPDPQGELDAALAAMEQQQAQVRAQTPTAHNPAKRMAGQLMGRYVTVIGSGYLAPVARRWKGQFNELAKALASFDLIPEADHNSLAATLQPEEWLGRVFVLFLRAASDHPRNRLRGDLTRRAFMLEGLSTDFYDAQGATPLAHMWTALHFGDYLAYYLALAYGVDPTPVEALEQFKRELREEG
jgi:glucose/mannose-6-phosphate isomerase